MNPQNSKPYMWPPVLEMIHSVGSEENTSRHSKTMIRNKALSVESVYDSSHQSVPFPETPEIWLNQEPSKPVVDYDSICGESWSEKAMNELNEV